VRIPRSSVLNSSFLSKNDARRLLNPTVDFFMIFCHFEGSHYFAIACLLAFQTNPLSRLGLRLWSYSVCGKFYACGLNQNSGTLSLLYFECVRVLFLGKYSSD
jgi:hypothetical protein